MTYQLVTIEIKIKKRKLYTPNCNNVVIEKSKKQKAKIIGINKPNLIFHCSQILYVNEKYNINE